MTVNELLVKKGITQYRLSKLSGVAYATLNDICSGKTQIGKCSAETLYRIARALNVSMETFMEAPKQNSYEYGLPSYLQRDLDAYKEGIERGSTFLDCLWGELYGSINIAEINEGVITPEHADYLRKKFLWR